MAPKNKFTREQIISAALELTRKQGASALTARALAKALGVSTQPVFTCFTTMEEAREEVCTAAWRVYQGYVERGLSMDPPFFGVGVQYLAFARQEPELYKLLFLQQNKEGKSEALAAMERSRVLVRPRICTFGTCGWWCTAWPRYWSQADVLTARKRWGKSLPVSVSVNAWPVRRFRALFPAHMTGMHCLRN